MAIPHNRVFTAGNSTFTATDVYERSANGVDPLYPEMFEAEGVTVTANRVTWSTTYADWQSTGFVMEGMGSLAGGGVGSYAGTNFWDGTRGCIDCSYWPSAASLNGTNYNPLIWLADPGLVTQLILWGYDQASGDMQIRYATEGGIVDIFFAPAVTPANGVEFLCQMEWECGTYDEVTDTHAADGHITLTVNGTQVYSATNISLYLTYFSSPPDRINAVGIGYFGLVGAVEEVNVRAILCSGEVEVTDDLDLCCGEGQSETVVTDGGGQGNGGDVFQTPTIGTPIGCVGGGTVPTQADITYSETWWGA